MDQLITPPPTPPSTPPPISPTSVSISLPPDCPTLGRREEHTNCLAYEIRPGHYRVRFIKAMISNTEGEIEFPTEAVLQKYDCRRSHHAAILAVKDLEAGGVGRYSMGRLLIRPDDPLDPNYEFTSDHDEEYVASFFVTRRGSP